MKTALFGLAAFIVIIAAIDGGMIAFGTSAPPQPLTSIGAPFKKVDFSDLPALETIPARNGGTIAFRRWTSPETTAPGPIVIAIHGSSGSSTSLHPLGKALRAERFTLYAPDVRGHGGTGQRGDIDYSGQLDDDFADFIAALKSRHPGQPFALMGFSSGGGYALHLSASALGSEFQRAILLSPMLGPRAPTVKITGDAWASPFLPRIFGLIFLNKLGIHNFDYLTTLAFAIDPVQAKFLTGTYSFRLMQAFGTAGYAADLKNARPAVQVLVGSSDELFAADRFAPTIHAVRLDIPVTIVPGVNHIGLTTDPQAVPAIVAALHGAQT
ncbi:MAG: alpha/beta hydrolase [Rhodomicrobium sp.]